MNHEDFEYEIINRLEQNGYVDFEIIVRHKEGLVPESRTPKNVHVNEATDEQLAIFGASEIARVIREWEEQQNAQEN